MSSLLHVSFVFFRYSTPSKAPLTSESLVASDNSAPEAHDNTVPLVADSSIKTPFFQPVMQPTAAVNTPQVQNGSGMQLIDFDDMQGGGPDAVQHKPHQNGVGYTGVTADLLTPTTTSNGSPMLGDGHQSNGHDNAVPININDGNPPPVTVQDLLS